jgi:hypothetical protein
MEQACFRREGRALVCSLRSAGRCLRWRQDPPATAAPAVRPMPPATGRSPLRHAAAAAHARARSPVRQRSARPIRRIHRTEPVVWPDQRADVLGPLAIGIASEPQAARQGQRNLDGMVRTRRGVPGLAPDPEASPGPQQHATDSGDRPRIDVSRFVQASARHGSRNAFHGHTVRNLVSTNGARNAIAHHLFLQLSRMSRCRCTCGCQATAPASQTPAAASCQCGPSCRCEERQQPCGCR